MATEAVNPDGSQRSRTDQLARRVFAGGPSTRQTYPTPTAAAASGGQTSRSGARKDEKLLTGRALEAEDRRTWATPKASPSGLDNARKNRDGSAGDDLVTKVQGQLNPDWVEWLMGWPVRWTSLDPLPAANWRAWAEAFLTE